MSELEHYAIRLFAIIHGGDWSAACKEFYCQTGHRQERWKALARHINGRLRNSERPCNTKEP